MVKQISGPSESSFTEAFLRDVPRGVSHQRLKQHSLPQARWMNTEDILGSDKLAYDPRAPGKKVLIGSLNGQLLGIEDDRHMLTVAGSRSGKSVGLISNLFFYAGSTLVTDPKAELANLTAAARDKLGQRVHVLDPFGMADDSVGHFRKSYNPMGVLKLTSPTFLEDAALIAEALVVGSADQKEPHWDESARNFIEGVIVHVATDAKYAAKRHLVTVRELLTLALWVRPKDLIADKGAKAGLHDQMTQNAEALLKWPETVAIGNSLMGAALDFYSKSDSERAGVQSTVNRHTKFLDYPAFRGVLEYSDFELGDLKSVAGGVSIYLCFPATRAEISMRWMRIFVNQLLDAMEREKTKPAAPVLPSSTPNAVSC